MQDRRTSGRPGSLPSEWTTKSKARRVKGHRHEFIFRNRGHWLRVDLTTLRQAMVWSPEAGDQRTTQLADANGHSSSDPEEIAQIPMNMMSRNTLGNISKNKQRIDYCVSTFAYISNRCRAGGGAWVACRPWARCRYLYVGATVAQAHPSRAGRRVAPHSWTAPCVKTCGYRGNEICDCGVHGVRRIKCIESTTGGPFLM